MALDKSQRLPYVIRKGVEAWCCKKAFWNDGRTQVPVSLEHFYYYSLSAAGPALERVVDEVQRRLDVSTANCKQRSKARKREDLGLEARPSQPNSGQDSCSVNGSLPEHAFVQAPSFDV